MADTTSPQAGAHEPLGVGSIIGESFSIFFKRIIQILILGFVLTLASNLINLALFGPDFMTGAAAQDLALTNPGAFWSQTLVSTIIGMVFFGIMIGAFTLLAYDAKLGRSARLGTYVSAALKNILPIAILTFVATIIISIGTAFFIIPGLWLMAVLSVIVPAIVVENAGFGAMGRSASLTKEYRWPIIGVWIVFLIIMIVISMILGGVLGVAMFAGASAGAEIGTGAVIGFLVFSSLISAVLYGLLSIPAALIYARLREIKEGISVDSLAEVFS